MNLEIRSATLADIPLIRELTMQVWPQTYTPIIGAEQVNYMLDRFYNPEALRQQIEGGHKFLLAYDNGEPVAFASYSETEPQIYKLHKLYIIAGQQGKGIGRILIDNIVEDLKQRKVSALRLNVNKYNTAAQAFYEKTGFRQILEEDIDIGNGYFMNDYVLALLINDGIF